MSLISIIILSCDQNLLFSLIQKIFNSISIVYLPAPFYSQEWTLKRQREVTLLNKIVTTEIVNDGILGPCFEETTSVELK